jgi:hypothetical protein
MMIILVKFNFFVAAFWSRIASFVVTPFFVQSFYFPVCSRKSFVLVYRDVGFRPAGAWNTIHSVCTYTACLKMCSKKVPVLVCSQQRCHKKSLKVFVQRLEKVSCMEFSASFCVEVEFEYRSTDSWNLFYVANYFPSN